MAKVIKNSTDYKEALSEVDRLVERDPAPGTPEADRLELLTVLIQGYESKRISARPHDPLEAIRFRMDQQGLTQRDLVPFIGSRSKVSEVLAGKRPLTLSMIRALHRGLGIPAESLLQEPSPVLDPADLEWERFPVREMVARGWVEGVSPRTRFEAEDVVRRFVGTLDGKLSLPAFYKKSKLRTGRSLDQHALMAWTFRVAIRARRQGLPGRCNPGTVTPDFMREVAQLSWSTRGPLLAQEFLQRRGIALIVEPHLSHTRLDGAAILLDTDQPVIGLTLRYDRIDNFWHALIHELAHVSLQLKTVGESFCDDLDVEDHDDPREKEADTAAREALVPASAWAASPARVLRSPEAAEDLAERLRVHPAIIAGRMRFEARNYRILTQLIGSGEVRKLFPEIQWSPTL